MGGPEDDGVEGQLLVDRPAREAEVEDGDDVVGADDDVLALQVAVDDPLFVRGLRPEADLPEDGEGACRSDAALLEDQALEVLSRDVLHRDEGVPGDGAEVEHPGDVRVLHLAVQADLALEPGEGRPVLDGDVAVEDLDRDDLVEVPVQSLEDDAHAPPTERLEPLVSGGAAEELDPELVEVHFESSTLARTGRARGDRSLSPMP